MIDNTKLQTVVYCLYKVLLTDLFTCSMVGFSRSMVLESDEYF